MCVFLIFKEDIIDLIQSYSPNSYYELRSYNIQYPNHRPSIKPKTMKLITH